MRDAALDLAEQWGWPYYLSIHDYLSEDATIRVSKRWCRGMIVPCAELADELKTTLGVPSRLIKVVRPGIRIEDGGDCSAAAPRRPLNDGNVPVIGMAGPLAPSAGLLAFLKAAQKVLEQGFDVEFTIAGRPNAAGDVELRKRIERLRLSDRLTLVLDPALRSVFWNVLDIYCQPSQAPTTGDFLIRAMARGIPVIATQVKSLRGLIHPDGNGLSIPVNDSDALAKAMISLLRDHESARRLGANAREWALAQFDPQREARELVELYDDI